MQHPAILSNANLYRLLVPSCYLCLIKMSLFWLLAGRNDKKNKSSCLVKVESDGNNKPYGLQLVGKNQTNLRVKW